MNIIGNLALVTSLVIGALSLMLIKFNKNHDIGIKAGILSNIFIIISSMVLFYLLISGDFSVDFVFKNTERSLPLIYKISAFWSGSSGSLLLWTTCISIMYIFIYVLLHIKKYNNKEYISCLTSLSLIFNLAFLVALIFINNPFKVTGANPDGFGLNPSLQSWGMVFHPPLVMISYSLIFLAFASNLYEIFSVRSQAKLQQKSNDLQASFIKSLTINITLTGWIILTAGIVSGGIWAYSELGWGGYWSWDPIENSALVTWLLVTAYLHLLSLHRKSTASHPSSFILISASVFSILFGTFLARSGILNSVHSYTSKESKVFFSLMMIVVAVVCLAIFITFIRKRDKIKTSISHLNSFIPYVTPLIMVISAIIITLMTIYPLFPHKDLKITENTYDFVFGIAGLIFLIFSTIFYLKKTSNKLKIFIISISFIFGGITFFLPAFSIYSYFTRISMAVCVFCLISTVMYFGFNINYLFDNSICMTIFVIHVSIIIMAFGFIGTRNMKLETTRVIDPNDTITIANHDLKLISISVDDGAQKKTWTADFTYTDGNSQKNIKASLQYYKKKNVYHSKAFIDRSFKEDFYMIVENVLADGGLVLKVSIFKWVSFLWIGIILMTLMSIIILKNSLSKASMFGNT